MTDVGIPVEESAAFVAHEEEQVHHTGHASSLGLSNTKLAFWLFLGSECLLFGALISTYLLSVGNFVGQVVAGNPRVVTTMPAEVMNEIAEKGSVNSFFDIPFTSASSFILLMSSLTMVLAHKAVSEGNQRATKIWLSATAMLGATFISGQVYEFTVFYREGLHYDGNLFGSAFYTLTGFHGAHVTIGILMLVALLIMAFKGKLQADRAETVEIIGLYWHFVDVVWVLIFTVVYLIP